MRRGGADGIEREEVTDFAALSGSGVEAALGGRKLLGGSMKFIGEKIGISGEIQAQAEQKNLPFELSFSIGCIRTDWTADRNLDEYVKEADEIMYQEKSRKKLNRME